MAEIETDKATVDFDVVDGGTVAKIILEEGAQDVPIGTPLLVLADEPEDIGAFADFTPDAEPAAAPSEPAEAAPPPPPPPPPAAAAAPAAPAQAAAPVSLPAAGGRMYWNAEKGWFRG